MQTDVIIFALGFLVKAFVSATLAEVITRPIAKKVNRWIRHQPAVKHYLDGHIGVSHKCQQCSPVLPSPSTGN